MWCSSNDDDCFVCLGKNTNGVCLKMSSRITPRTSGNSTYSIQYSTTTVVHTHFSHLIWDRAQLCYSFSISSGFPWTEVTCKILILGRLISCHQCGLWHTISHCLWDTRFYWHFRFMSFTCNKISVSLPWCADRLSKSVTEFILWSPPEYNYYWVHSEHLEMIQIQLTEKVCTWTQNGNECLQCKYKLA